MGTQERPVFIGIGYEFNGIHNVSEPEVYTVHSGELLTQGRCCLSPITHQSGFQPQPHQELTSTTMAELVFGDYWFEPKREET
jgi:hypothetical protein